MNFIKRTISHKILDAFQYFSVIVITGPRQVGKTTLCRNLWPDFAYYNLEDVALREIINEDPKRFIFDSPNEIIIDEIQNIPNLFSYIQICVDENPNRKFILTGSNNFALMENITQSLAGRAALFTLLPFSFKEVSTYIDSHETDHLLFNGLYPATVVKNIPGQLFFGNYYTTYIERDVRKIRNIENLELFQTFMKIIAGRVSTVFNASSISSATGVSSPTIKSWLGILKTSYILFSLRPYYKNIEKRLTKSPKIYFYDTGLLCFLLGIREPYQLVSHPLRGAIFENFVIAELLKEQINKGDTNDLYFYREEKGHEVDVLKVKGEDIHLYEIKSSKTFNSDFTKNLKYLSELLGENVKSAQVVYDGETVAPVTLNFRQI